MYNYHNNLPDPVTFSSCCDHFCQSPFRYDKAWNAKNRVIILFAFLPQTPSYSVPLFKPMLPSWLLDTIIRAIKTSEFSHLLGNRYILSPVLWGTTWGSSFQTWAPDTSQWLSMHIHSVAIRERHFHTAFDSIWRERSFACVRRPKVTL